MTQWRAILRRISKVGGLTVVTLAMVGMAAWGVLALMYWDHANPTLRLALASAYGVGASLLIVGFVGRRWRRRAVATFVTLFAVLVALWFAIAPSNNRDWQPENAVLARASIDGDRITLRNIRNFDYRTETDFTPAYYDRTFDLRELDAVDLFAVYWMGPAIAHVFLSFGFTDGSHVAISVEARKERSEGYSTVQGFFRQYELYYVVADERDVVRLRTNYRRNPPEHVYLYRLRGSPQNARALFLAYVREIDSLQRHPQWYNSLTSNCTNSIWALARVLPGHVPYSWKILISGYLPEYLYENGTLDTRVPFVELQRRADISAPAQAADQAPDFSQRIRCRQVDQNPLPASCSSSSVQ